MTMTLKENSMLKKKHVMTQQTAVERVHCIGSQSQQMSILSANSCVHNLVYTRKSARSTYIPLTFGELTSPIGKKVP